MTLVGKLVEQAKKENVIGGSIRKVGDLLDRIDNQHKLELKEIYHEGYNNAIKDFQIILSEVGLEFNIMISRICDAKRNGRHIALVDDIMSDGLKVMGEVAGYKFERIKSVCDATEWFVTW